MTEKELLDFCIENKGKMASGKVKANGIPKLLSSNKIVRGRIIAYTIINKQAFILLEDAKGTDKILPNPLPDVPHRLDGWFRLISPAKVGFACFAETVVVDEQVSDQATQVATTVVTQPTQPQAQQSTPRICLHGECDTNWCHRQYSGVI